MKSRTKAAPSYADRPKLIENKEAVHISYYKDDSGSYLAAYSLEGDLWERAFLKNFLLRKRNPWLVNVPFNQQRIQKEFKLRYASKSKYRRIANRKNEWSSP